jgi:hypothetical protein
MVVLRPGEVDSWRGGVGTRLVKGDRVPSFFACNSCCCTKSPYAAINRFVGKANDAEASIFEDSSCDASGVGIGLTEGGPFIKFYGCGNLSEFSETDAAVLLSAVFSFNSDLSTRDLVFFLERFSGLTGDLSDLFDMEGELIDTLATRLRVLYGRDFDSANH